jgi:flagellar motor switch protein FliN/FliY
MASDTPTDNDPNGTMADMGPPPEDNPTLPEDDPIIAMPLEHFGMDEPLASEMATNQNDRTANDLSTVFEVPVSISAVLGRSTLSVAQLLQLGAGSVLELDRKVGEAIDIFVNNRLVARGEVVIVDDHLGVTMTEIIKDGDNQN